ncbi:MAG: SUMF1/EgtB/PvdO family nonheme iron enzyme [Planctomycetota bacterium]|nr:SUMF1/EgtB/PvdO family nonheme iron enzyme [Planctomycetota bacterium]
MVRIQGDRYEIGADKDYVKEMIEKLQLRPLASEYPKHEVKLDDFYYMPTEVTNEQFAAFIEATGSEPPMSWGKAAIDAAGLAYATETGKAKKDARDAGQPIPKFDEFKDSAWWGKNWKDVDWAVPEGLANHPVVYITHDQAEAYARWAGLRLISEEEHQVAGRGSEDRLYPWGDEFVVGAANCVEARVGKTTPVGSYEKGASWVDAKGRVVEKTDKNADELQPIYDLSGSVWEWTRSPFKAYPKFKPLEVKIQGSKEKVTPEFDADHRVAVSGDFGSPSLATRLTTRRGTARWQATSAMGMRCSASTIPGLDIADSILRMDLPTSKRPDNTNYAPSQIVAIDRWISERGTGGPDNYRVIKSYEYLAMIPVEETRIGGVPSLKNKSVELPVQVGAFSTTVPLIEPALEPGTYTVAYRAGSKPIVVAPPKDKQDKEEGDEEAGDEVEEPMFPFDVTRETLIFSNTQGEIVAWVYCEEPEEIRLAPGRVAVHQREAEELSKRELDAGKVPKPAATIVTMHFLAPSKKRNQGFEFQLPLATAAGSVDSTWRK